MERKAQGLKAEPGRESEFQAYLDKGKKNYELDNEGKIK